MYTKNLKPSRDKTMSTTVTPQNVIIAAKCNTNAKCNNNRRKM